MVKIKRAMALLLMTILILANTDFSYAAEDIDSVVSDASEEGKLVDIVDEKPALAATAFDTSDPDEDADKDDDLEEDEDQDKDTDQDVDQDENPDLIDEEPVKEPVDEDLSALDEEQLLEGQGFLKYNPLDRKPLPIPQKESTYDICFYIRGNGIGADIPEEPSTSWFTQYSAPIRVDDAVDSDNLRLSESEVDGSLESLLTDGFTASNDVTGILNRVPSADEIRNVIPGFDPEQHYVVWYVVKRAYTLGRNRDVYIHVDGVIRQRQLQEDAPSEEVQKERYTTGDPERDARILEVEEGIDFYIVPQYRDAEGRELKDIEYDGKTHMVGGFDIVIVDKNDKNRKPLEDFLYNYLGNFLSHTVHAEGDGTTFKYMGETFHLNITSAYTTVVDFIEEDIKFYCGSQEVPYDEIVVTDERGEPLTDKTHLSASAGPILGPGIPSIDLKKRKLVIEAGTTVKNDDGSTITNDTYKIIEGSLAEGHSIKSIVFNGSQTGVGQCSNDITSICIVNEDGFDITNMYYDVKTVSGKLQLVDGSRKSMRGSAAASSNGGTTVTGGTGSIANNSKSFGTVFKAKVTHADGSVTYINVPFETSAGLDLSDNQPQVLGARRAGTGDDRIPLLRYMIILICIGLMTLLCIQKTKRWVNHLRHSRNRTSLLHCPRLKK